MRSHGDQVVEPGNTVARKQNFLQLHALIACVQGHGFRVAAAGPADRAPLPLDKTPQ